MLISKKLGLQNQRTGLEAEQFVLKKLKSLKWTVIPTKGSKSSMDIIAYHQRKKLWWGIQVKSTIAKMTFDMEDLAVICNDLYLTPILAYVKNKKPRELYFCMKKGGKFYHIYPDGLDYHILGEEVDCVAFKHKISMI